MWILGKSDSNKPQMSDSKDSSTIPDDLVIEELEPNDEFVSVAEEPEEAGDSLVE